MGRWADKLKNYENGKSRHTQNHQKPENTPFEPFECALSGQNQKYPAVWQVQLRTGDRVYSMTVIDPDRMPDDQFIRYLNEKFGADRIVSATKRFN